MSGSSFFKGIVAALLVVSIVGASTMAATAVGTLATSSVVRAWSEPASGYGFLDAAILSAHHSIDLSMYELADATVERDLVARANAGVDVRVLLNAAYEGTSHNAAAYAFLRASRVHVEWAPTNQIFHAKYLVVDGRAAYVAGQPGIGLLLLDARFLRSRTSDRVTSRRWRRPLTPISDIAARPFTPEDWCGVPVRRRHWCH